jgi:hypothetical protein
LWRDEGYGDSQLLVIYKLRRKRTNAPTPEAISARLATKVTGSINSGPPFLGSAAIVAVAVVVGTGPAWQGSPVPESVKSPSPATGTNCQS